MNRRYWLLGGVLLLAGPAVHAQTVLAHAASAPPPASALPPPGMQDAGPTTQSIPLPSTGIAPSVAPAAQKHDAGGNTPPDVAVTTNANGDTVETYSRNGHAYMVRVTPKHGLPQTYHYDNPNGSLVHDPRLGPVAPVYYTIYKWGGAAEPASSASSGQ